MAAWRGWTYAEIIIVAKATYGEGWSLVAASLAGVNATIYSAWTEALATFGQTDTDLDPDDPDGTASSATAQSTAFNQYWGHLALYKAGMVISPGSAATERFKQAAEDYRKADRLTADTTHIYDT